MEPPEVQQEAPPSRRSCNSGATQPQKRTLLIRGSILSKHDQFACSCDEIHCGRPAWIAVATCCHLHPSWPTHSTPYSTKSQFNISVVDGSLQTVSTKHRPPASRTRTSPHPRPRHPAPQRRSRSSNKAMHPMVHRSAARSSSRRPMASRALALAHTAGEQVRHSYLTHIYCCSPATLAQHILGGRGWKWLHDRLSPLASKTVILPDYVPHSLIAHTQGRKFSSP